MFFFKLHTDGVTTSFEINITDLKSITIIYVGDREKAETYKNLNAELLEANRIKIIFNPNYQDMGIIFLKVIGMIP